MNRCVCGIETYRPKFCSNKCSGKHWAKMNADKLKESAHKRYLANKTFRAAKNKEWLAANREKIRAIKRDRWLNDPQFKLRESIRNRIRNAMRRYAKGSKPRSTILAVGCTMTDLQAYIESKFQPGMTWQNWGINGWHIDHIRPLSSFDLTDKEQFDKAIHYTNLQPLWAADNIGKGAR